MNFDLERRRRERRFCKQVMQESTRIFKVRSKRLRNLPVLARTVRLVMAVLLAPEAFDLLKKVFDCGELEGPFLRLMMLLFRLNLI